MIISIAAAALAFQVGTAEVNPTPPQIQTVQYGVPVRRPPCGHGWDLSARDGLCYPNGYLPPQEQDAYYRRGYHRGDGYYRGGGGGYYRGGRVPVRCGHGADVDIRDGQCYPNGTVPREFQEGRRYHRY